MLCSLDEIIDYKVLADGERIGTLHDLYIDDRGWTTRYLVVDTGRWLPGRRTLIAPEAAKPADIVARTIELSVTSEQIWSCPLGDVTLPLSRQAEADLRAHYGWSPYWEAATSTRIERGPGRPCGQRAGETAGADTAGETSAESNLHSLLALKGYRVVGSDGEAGRVYDFLLELERWSIRYLIVETRNWLPGRKVLFGPAWITQIAWSDQLVRVALDRHSIRRSQRYDPAASLGPDQELETHEL